ncbi:MAG TPA: hypothetical protein VGQ53_14130 [Chitinophagaceae bacterium]|jgi:hypothetical protein|nr:hypothetical protein [Chitinophagaceae bacterium]
MNKGLLKTLAIIILLSSCSNNNGYNPNNLTTDTAAATSNNKNADSSASVGYLKIIGDAVVLSPFEIEVGLSPKASEKIMADKETIIISIYFTGIPKDSSTAKFEEDGSFYVASVDKEIQYGQVARFDSIRIPLRIFDQLRNKDIDLGVNVYSGRKSSQSNLLNCEPLFDKISNVANKRFILKGKLIYGDD